MCLLLKQLKRAAPQLSTAVSAGLDVLVEQTKEDQPIYADAVLATVIGALSQVRRFIVTDDLQIALNEKTNPIIDGTIPQCAKCVHNQA